MPVSGTFFDEHNSYVGMTVAVQNNGLAKNTISNNSFEGPSPERLPKRVGLTPKELDTVGFRSKSHPLRISRTAYFAHLRQLLSIGYGNRLDKEEAAAKKS
jgi:hypothetical protein